MPLLRLRVTGSEDDVRAIGNLLQSLEGVGHVEEIDDLMPHMDDADSSSAGPARSGWNQPHGRSHARITFSAKWGQLSLLRPSNTAA